MFFLQPGEGFRKILIVYVDDIIIAKDNLVEIESLKKIVAIEFEVRGVG